MVPIHGVYASVHPGGTVVAYSTCQWSKGVFPFEEREVNDKSTFHYELASLSIELEGWEARQPERITYTEYLEHYPVWSPDGKRLAYVGSTTKIGDLDLYHSSIYVNSLDGSAPFGVSKSLKGIALIPPMWSPDGRHIAFVVRDGVEFRKSGGWLLHETQVLYIVDDQGGDLREVGPVDGIPSWSPDSQLVAFGASERGDVGIYLAGREEGQETQKIPLSGQKLAIPGVESWEGSLAVSQVAWSPDGQFIAVVVEDFSYGYNIWISGAVYVFRVDGWDMWRLGLESAWPWELSYRVAWSPDGKRIAVRGDRELIGNPAALQERQSLRLLATMAPDGTDRHVLVERGH